jgi:hypothetical protein
VGCRLRSSHACQPHLSWGIYDGSVPTIPNLYANVIVPFYPNFSSRAAAVTFGVSNVAALATPTDIAEAVWPAWFDNMKSRIDSDVLMGPLHVQQGTASGINSGDGTSSGAGTAGSSAPTPQVAVLVKKQTGVGGRANRGRFYLPWAVDESGLDQAGNIDPTVVTAVNTACAGLLADLATAQVPMYILHNGVGIPTQVLSMSCESVVATQRRRVVR